MMNIIKISKALSNETRVNILKWLKEPKKNFPPQGDALSENVDLKGGVCVTSIQEKAGVSQSAISNYLALLHDAGLLVSERHEKWTYYRRNEKLISDYAKYIKNEL